MSAFSQHLRKSAITFGPKNRIINRNSNFKHLPAISNPIFTNFTRSFSSSDGPSSKNDKAIQPDLCIVGENQCLEEDGFCVKPPQCEVSASINRTKSSNVNKSNSSKVTPLHSLYQSQTYEGVPLTNHRRNFSNDRFQEVKDDKRGSNNFKGPLDSANAMIRGYKSVHIDRRDLIRKSKKKLDEIYSYDSDKNKLGEGGYGNVFLAEHKLTHQRVACKKIPGAAANPEQWEMLENEILSMMDLDHPHICNLYEYFVENDDVYLILELLGGPDLFDKMLEVFNTEPGRFDEFQTGLLLRHMLKAVFGCHSVNIVHRDLKPENFMFSQAADLADGGDLKMIDLGLSKRHQKEGDKMIDAAGSVGYMAPEMLTADPSYNRSCDIWSLGCISYIMLTGEPLFPLTDDAKAMLQIKNPNHIKKKLRSHRKLLSKEAIHILEAMLNHSPTKRITATEALAHPFVMKTYMGTDGVHSVFDDDKILKMEDVLFKMRKFAELPLLKRSALIVLAHLVGTGSELLESHRLTFRRLDTDGGGSLSREEFQDGMLREAKRQGKENFEFPKDFESFVWPNVDLNQSDDINFTEFLASCISDDKEIVSSAQNWKGVFQVLDIDNTGELNADDLNDLFHDNANEGINAMLSEVVPDTMALTPDDFVKLMMKDIAVEETGA